MKVGITGHTAGIGLLLSYELVKNGHETAGFSRSNGYTFEHDPSAVKRCVKKLNDEDFDVAVLNAPVAQIELFKELFKEWRDKEKRILIMNSFMRFQEVIDAGIGRQFNRERKRALYHAVCESAFDNLDGSRPFRKCIINNFTLGPINTVKKPKDGVLELDPRCLSREYVVNHLINTIESDRSIEQFDIALRVL